MSYADVLKKVEPLRDELKSLENQASDNKVKNEETTALIAQLEQTITEYQEEYAQLISQAQAIKSDLENVQSKVCFLNFCVEFYCLLTNFMFRLIGLLLY